MQFNASVVSQPSTQQQKAGAACLLPSTTAHGVVLQLSMLCRSSQNACYTSQRLQLASPAHAHKAPDKITIIPVTPCPHILATQLFNRSSDGWRCSSRWRLYRATHLELHKNNKTRAVHQAPKPRSHSRISAPSRWRRPAIMLQSVTPVTQMLPSVTR